MEKNGRGNWEKFRETVHSAQCGGLTLIDEHLRINDPMHYYDYWMDLRQHESSIF